MPEFYVIFSPKKINKIPAFYMTFARTMPKFYIIFARKIFLWDFWGVGTSLPPFLPPSLLRL